MGTDSHRNGWDPVVNNRHGDGVDAFLGIPVGSADREGASAAGDRSRGWCGAVTPVDRRRVVANSLGPPGSVKVARVCDWPATPSFWVIGLTGVADTGGSATPMLEVAAAESPSLSAIETWTAYVPSSA